MKNQSGVTLVELLVIIAIMGAILIPISIMGIYALETEKEISAKNDVQREARLIMEYMTEKMRNKNVVWIKEETQWKLCDSSDGFTCSSPNSYLNYEPNTNPALGLGTMKMGLGNVLSSNVKFTPPAIPNEDDDNQQLVTVELTIDKTEETGESFVLKSEIYYDRFNKVISESGTEDEQTEVPLEEGEEDPESEIEQPEEDKNKPKKVRVDNGECPPGYYKHNNNWCRLN